MSWKMFFKILFLSFYSRGFYMEVLAKWKHWGMGFLLRFSMLIALIVAMILFGIISMIDFRSDAIQNIIKQIPAIEITESKAKFMNKDIESPVHIGANSNFMVVDLDNNSIEKYSAHLLVFNAHGITLNAIESSPLTISYQDFLKNSEFNVINDISLTSFLAKGQRYILTIILLVGFSLGTLVYFFLALLQVIFYASIAFIFSNILKYNLNLKQLTRVAVIVYAPAIIISNILGLIFFLFGITQDSQFIFNAIYLLYFAGIISAYTKLRNSSKY
jgi:hypothetical protein